MLLASSPLLTKHATSHRSRIISGDIGHRSISAVIWSAGGTTLRTFVSIGSQIILARLLGPDQYGLFAAGLVVTFLINIFAGSSLAYGLIQRLAVSEEDIRFVFTWQMVLSIIVCISLIVAAPLVSWIFKDARLTSVVRILSMTAIITALGTTSASLLQRNLDFKTLNVASVLSYAIAFPCVAIPLALVGYGVLALLAGFLLQALLSSVITYARVRHSCRPLLWHHDASGILGFGATMFATLVVNWVMSSLDRAIVGGTLGVTATGLYSTMHALIYTPAQAALATLQPVFYSAGAKIQGNLGNLSYGARAMFGAICLFVAPVFVGVAVVADTFVLALYGSKWVGGAQVLAPLALAMPVMLLMGMATPVLWTVGQTRKEVQLQTPLTLVWAFGCYGVAQSGSLAAVGWAVCAMYVVRAAMIIRAVLSAVGISAWELPALFAPGIVTCGIAAVAAKLVDNSLQSFPIGPLARLSLVIAACALALAAGLRLVRAHLPTELKSVLQKLSVRVPNGSLRLAFDRVLLS